MHDVLIIGGSFAGLSAAIYAARGRHDVCVLDTGTPRNRFSPVAHGFFAHDGDSPANIIAQARHQIAAYPNVTFRDAEAADAVAVDGGFRVTLNDASAVTARRLVIASGVEDHLPPITGLAERWGKSVLHCPYCHGYEFSGQRLGVLYAGPASVHHAQMIANWGPTTLFLDGAALTDDEQTLLAEKGIAVVPGKVEELTGAGDALERILVEGAAPVALDALYTAVRVSIRGNMAAKLGCATRDTPIGHLLEVDDTFMTSVPGIYAAGDVARFPSVALNAAADGALAGGAVSQSLIFGLTK